MPFNKLVSKMVGLIVSVRIGTGGLETDGFVDSRIQGFKDSRIQGFKDSRIQGFKDSRIQGFKDSRIQGFGNWLKDNVKGCFGQYLRT
jgi:hypothetical protein